MKQIYLAIPYTGIEEESYQLANKVTVKLLMQGYNVFSPITHSHVLAKEHGLKGTWDFWQNIDYQFIDWCDEIWVVIPNKDLDLVLKSTGVMAEIKYGKEKNKPVKFIRKVTNNIVGFHNYKTI